jgi:hypothetical protein
LAGVYDAPRRLLESIPGIELREMPRSRENGVCCGTTGWMNCSSCSKEIQVERLAEASNTGAGTLVTACPKCQIHFRCAKAAFDLKIEINDLYDIVADRLKIGWVKNPLPWNIPLRGEGSGFYELLKGATIKDNLLNAKWLKWSKVTKVKEFFVL